MDKCKITTSWKENFQKSLIWEEKLGINRNFVCFFFCIVRRTGRNSCARETLLFLAGVAQRLFAASKDSKQGGKFKLQPTPLAFTKAKRPKIFTVWVFFKYKSSNWPIKKNYPSTTSIPSTGKHTVYCSYNAKML